MRSGPRPSRDLLPLASVPYRTSTMSLAIPALLSSARPLSSPGEAELSDSGFYSESLASDVRQSSPELDDADSATDTESTRESSVLRLRSSKTQPLLVGARCPQLTGSLSPEKPASARATAVDVAHRFLLTRCHFGATASCQHASQGVGRSSGQGTL